MSFYLSIMSFKICSAGAFKIVTKMLSPAPEFNSSRLCPLSLIPVLSSATTIFHFWIYSDEIFWQHQQVSSWKPINENANCQNADHMIAWCSNTSLQLCVSKRKEMVLDFCRMSNPMEPNPRRGLELGRPFSVYRNHLCVQREVIVVPRWIYQVCIVA